MSDMVATEIRERGLTAPRNLMREEQRSEQRFDGGNQGATIFLRGRASNARVVNISTSGAMLETAVIPLLDEHVVISFDGCTPVHAAVRWVKGGRVGVHFGRVLVLA
jgi:hypothetical protein